jgi:hypothetical protein
MTGDSTGTVAHQITAEWRGKQVAETRRDRKIPLIDRMLLPRKQLPRYRRRDDDRVGQSQWYLRQDSVFGAVDNPCPGRHHNMREM